MKGVLNIPERKKVTNEIVELNSLDGLRVFSKELKRFIVTQKLFSNIQGKNYVNVEGWEFAGAATGISPMITKIERVESTGEIKYRAEVELRNVAGDVVGFGMAICSDKESGKKGKDEYVIASMAQTRAIGKAYRNKLAFLMKMAGYEPTPSEEIEEKKTNKEENEVVRNDVEEKLKKAEVKDGGKNNVQSV